MCVEQPIAKQGPHNKAITCWFGRTSPLLSASLLLCEPDHFAAVVSLLSASRSGLGQSVVSQACN
jgi:hypothetical protein